jgi:magnesium transporter
MSKKINRRKVSPGELLHIGKKKQSEIAMQLFSYNSESLSERESLEIHEVKGIELNDSGMVHWLNLYGLHDIDVLKEIGVTFSIDNMALEDTLNTTHRPKIEEFTDHLFFTLKVLNRNNNLLDTEQISFVVGENYLVSFQEKTGDFFEHIRDRLRKKKGPAREKKAGFLFYLMVDALLDTYYQLNDEYYKIYSGLNDQIFAKADKEMAHKIEKVKREILFIKKSLAPLKEAILMLEKGNPFIKKEDRKYFSDLRDSVLEINESFDALMQLMESTSNLYFTIISNKANDIMKVLTIIATIFIPLTFIAGIYGMNFEYMPELAWKYSYPVLWGVILLVFVGMFIFFKRKKWF